MTEEQFLFGLNNLVKAIITPEFRRLNILKDWKLSPPTSKIDRLRYRLAYSPGPKIKPGKKKRFFYRFSLGVQSFEIIEDTCFSGLQAINIGNS